MRDHFVPQQMIRRFANSAGLLYELRKDQLRIGTKPRPQAGILWREDYYEDRLGDLDEEWFKTTEDRFGRLYGQFAADWSNAVSVIESNAEWFVEWGLSLACRGEFATEFIRPHIEAAPGWLDTAANRFRRQLRDQFFGSDFLGRSLQFGVRATPKELPFILSDEPAWMTNHASGQLNLVVPLSSERMVIVGHPESVASWMQANALQVNSHFVARANRSVFCAAQEPLTDLLQVITEPVAYINPEWQKYARLPLFGLRERRAAGIPPPDPRPTHS